MPFNVSQVMEAYMHNRIKRKQNIAVPPKLPQLLTYNPKKKPRTKRQSLLENELQFDMYLALLKLSEKFTICYTVNITAL